MLKRFFNRPAVPLSERPRLDANPAFAAESSEQKQVLPLEEQSLSDYILDFSTESTDQRQYALTHLGRLVRTLELTPFGGPSDRVLEMGAYMQITPALKTRRGYGEVRGCYLGTLGVCNEKVVKSRTGEQFRCFIDLFNAEKDRYPYSDGSFSTVICGELFEHLAEDPIYMLTEVNRILRMGGTLVFSTPNICSFRSIEAILNGNHPGLFQQFILPRNGEIDPRHAREYTPKELSLAIEGAGFAIDTIETGPYGPETTAHELAVEVLREKRLSLDLRGDTIHVVAHKIGPVRERFPQWLYV